LPRFDLVDVQRVDADAQVGCRIAQGGIGDGLLVGA
jgi:hypothetical protein